MKTTKAKAWAALAFTGLGNAITLGLVPQHWQPLALVLVTLGTPLGVYAVPNKPLPA